MRQLRFLLLAVMLLSFASCSGGGKKYSKDPRMNELNGYLGAKWGMSTKEVSEASGFKGQRNSRSDPEEEFGVAQQGYVLMLPAGTIEYAKAVFQNDSLYSIETNWRTIKDFSTPKEAYDYISGVFYQNVDALIEAYGQPTNRVISTSMRYGRINDGYTWTGKKTTIYAYMSVPIDDPSHADFYITFESADAFEKEYKEAKVSDKRIDFNTIMALGGM